MIMKERMIFMYDKRVILYSTGCPKCGILKRKLDENGIAYDTVSDVDEMIRLGINSAPYLGVDDKLMDFKQAVDWVRTKI